MFTQAEFEALSGSSVDSDTFTVLHRFAVGIVEAECRRHWEEDPDDLTQIIRVGDSGDVVLPRGVEAVESVMWVGGDGAVSNAPAMYTWDGLNIIHLSGPDQVLNSPEWLDEVDVNRTVEVTWTPTSETAPDDVVMVALSVAIRIQANPSGASNLSIDDYTQGWTGGGGGASLLPNERSILARYRTRGLSSQRTVAR